MIEIKTTLTLRCEGCRRTFLYVVDLESAEPSRDDGPAHALVAMNQIRSAALNLRNKAQEADWAHFLAIGQPLSRDLCGKCFAKIPIE